MLLSIRIVSMLLSTSIEPSLFLAREKAPIICSGAGSGDGLRQMGRRIGSFNFSSAGSGDGLRRMGLRRVESEHLESPAKKEWHLSQR